MAEPSAETFGLDDAALAEHADRLCRRMPMPGRSALISGGAGGIGRATAWLLARLGAHVVVAGRSASKLDAVVSRQCSARGLRSAVACGRHPRTRARSTRCSSKSGADAGRPRHSRQQRRRPVSAGGDRLLGEGLERRHQHQSQRHLVHDAGGRAALARRRATRQHRQYRRRDDARPLRRRPYDRGARGRHRPEPRASRSNGRRSASASIASRRARSKRRAGKSIRPRRAPPIRAPTR